MARHHLVIVFCMYTGTIQIKLGVVTSMSYTVTQSMFSLESLKKRSSLELLQVNITLKSCNIVLANIYRPPSSNKSLFCEEFGLLRTNLGTDVVDRLIICGDFNLPGTSSSSSSSSSSFILKTSISSTLN